MPELCHDAIAAVADVVDVNGMITTFAVACDELHEWV